MTIKEQIVLLSGDIPSNKAPRTLREEIIFLAEERLGEEMCENRENIQEEDK